MYITYTSVCLPILDYVTCTLKILFRKAAFERMHSKGCFRKAAFERIVCSHKLVHIRIQKFYVQQLNNTELIAINLSILGLKLRKIPNPEHHFWHN